MNVRRVVLVWFLYSRLLWLRVFLGKMPKSSSRCRIVLVVSSAVVDLLLFVWVIGLGYVIVYGCNDGIFIDGAGVISCSDLNFDAVVLFVVLNWLIV